MGSQPSSPSLRRTPGGRRTALLALTSASLLLSLFIWRNSKFWKVFVRNQILLRSLDNLKSEGEELSTIAFIMDWESPKIVASLIPKEMSSLRPWSRARASAWMMELKPTPQAYLDSILPSTFLITPPAPELPGLPFTAPSKNRVFLAFFLQRSTSSAALRQIFQCLRIWGGLTLSTNWRPKASPQAASWSLRSALSS